MAEKKKDERVELFIPRGSDRDDPNYFIGINGKNFVLPKGKKSMVPPEVKAEYERAERAIDAQSAKKNELAALGK